MDVGISKPTVISTALTDLNRYDWEAVIDESKGPASTKLEYIPLLHDGNPMFVNSFKAVTSSEKYKTVLSINEPDQCGCV